MRKFGLGVDVNGPGLFVLLMMLFIGFRLGVYFG